MLRWLIILVGLLASQTTVEARWKAEYANDPARSQWFQSLKDCNGQGCCGMADGYPYYDDYTDNADGSITLADGTIVQGCQVLRTNNPTGHAILFYNSVHIYCFIPGGGF